jgi:hypothetical protein
MPSGSRNEFRLGFSFSIRWSRPQQCHAQMSVIMHGIVHEKLSAMDSFYHSHKTAMHSTENTSVFHAQHCKHSCVSCTCTVFTHAQVPDLYSCNHAYKPAMHSVVHTHVPVPCTVPAMHIKACHHAHRNGSAFPWETMQIWGIFVFGSSPPYSL